MSGNNAVVGLVGHLTIATRGTAGPGEVLLQLRGGTETFLAWSDEPLPKGSPVLVVESRGGRTLAVVGWSDAPPRSEPPSE